jgi:hypothetical protein
MNQNFTLKLFAFSLVLFGTVAANGQANTNPTSGCENNTNDLCTTTPVVNSFATGAEGFTGTSTTTYVFAYNAGGQNLRVGGGTGRQTVAGASYTILSSAFDAAGGVTVGFTLNTGQDAPRYSDILVEAVSAANTGLVLASCQYKAPGNGGDGGSFCFSFTDPDLTSQTIRFRITLTTRPGNGNQGVGTFDDFRVAFVELAPTPVKFTSFEGKRVSNGMQLTWKVADEINVNKYEVERSIAGNNDFIVVGTVAAKGLGSYSFTDEAPLSGQVYYRVRNVDNDGLFSYSNQISFKNGTSTLVFRVLPTLVTSKTEVQHGTVTGNEAITLSTADGRMVRSLRPAAGSLKTTIEMGDLRPGFYILRYRTGSGTTETVKLVKQ